MKRFAAVLLITALLLSASACGESENGKEVVTSGDAGTESAAVTEEDYGYVDPGLVKKDYDGRGFTILYPEWSLYNNYYFADESNGEVVNDALYERARRVEEMFNIDFNYLTQGYIETIFPAVQKAVAAGLPDYDLALTHCATGLTGYITSGIVMNWNEIPGADLSKPYWNQSVRENFEVDGVLPFMSSDYILPDVNSIFFNKGMAEEYELDNPYEIVLEGKWTWDALRKMAKAVSKDINGDSIMDENDQYGFVAERGWQFGSVLTACGQSYLAKGNDGIPAIACNNEKTQSVLEMITSLIYHDDISYTWEYNAAYDPNNGGKPPVDFGANRSLFYLTPLSLATTFRDTEVDYGILPLPKYDEMQKDYLTLNWAGFMCVPRSVSDPELVGFVTEMLAAESCRTVIPAFYDILLGEKIARDDEAKQTLDIIFDNDVYDLGVNLSYYGIISSQIGNDAPDNSAYIAKNAASIEKAISDYVKGCEDYNS